MTRLRHYLRNWTFVLLVVGVLVFARMGLVQASPVTSGALKSGAEVYQGLVAVTSGEGGSSLMELGLNGSTIASTGDLYLRSNRLTGAQGVRFQKVGTKTNVHALGGVCLSGVCKDVWPTSGSGVSYWATAGTKIQPNPTTNAVTFNRTAWSSAGALDVVGQTSGAALDVNNINTGALAAAANFSGALNVLGDVNVTSRVSNDEIFSLQNSCSYDSPYRGNTCTPGPDGDLYCQGYVPEAYPTARCLTQTYKVWHAGNDGHTTATTCTQSPTGGGNREGMACSQALRCVGGPTPGASCTYAAGCGSGQCSADYDCNGGICRTTGLDASKIDSYPVSFLGDTISFSCGGQSPPPNSSKRCFCVNWDGAKKCIVLP